MEPADQQRIALGVRQPWAELILRGVKTIEVRSQQTQVRGTIFLYASKQVSPLSAAANAAAEHQLDIASLPKGLIVGTVDIVASSPSRPEDQAAACVPPEVLENHFSWRLENAVRFSEPLVPHFLPYGVWFYPFRPPRELGSDADSP